MAKEIIKLNEISKVYGELLASRLAEGYTIYLKTMGGTQGEYGRLDLTKDGGKTVHRLYMNRKSENGNAICNGTKVWFNVDVIQIIEEEFDNLKNSDILWNGKGKKLLEQNYYLIDRKRSGYKMDPRTSYTPSKYFIELAETKHYGRDSVQNKNDKPRKIKPTQKMVEIVNRFKGFKGIKLDDNESVEVGCYKPSDIFYRFSFKNRKHYLTIDKDSKYLPHN
jgi:hypothetical protein